MRCGCLLIVLTVVCIGIGIDGIHKSQFKSPTVLTYEQFSAIKPQEGWFKITGCFINLAELVYQTQRWKGASGPDSISKVWPPVHSIKKPDDKQAALVLATLF